MRDTVIKGRFWHVSKKEHIPDYLFFPSFHTHWPTVLNMCARTNVLPFELFQSFLFNITNWPPDGCLLSLLYHCNVVLANSLLKQQSYPLSKRYKLIRNSNMIYALHQGTGTNTGIKVTYLTVKFIVKRFQWGAPGTSSVFCHKQGARHVFLLWVILCSAQRMQARRQETKGSQQCCTSASQNGRYRLRG